MTPLQTVLSVKLPNIILAKAAGKSKAHRTLVSLALNKNLPPLPPDKDDTTHLTLNIPVALIAKVQETADRHGMTFSGAFAALANAGLLFLQGKEGRDDATREKIRSRVEKLLLVNDTDEDRPRQKEFWVKMATGLQLNRTVMLEGSTGVGKGRAIVSAAVMCAKEGKSPVLICAPTIKVLSQLFQQEFLDNPAAVKAARKLTLSFLPGSQEFVNEARLRAYLADHPSPSIQKWLNAGGPNHEATALSVMAKHAGIKLSWLTADLRKVAGDDLRADDFALSREDKKDDTIAGQQQLSALVKYARAADIVFCTHAMLARMAVTNWGIFPAMNERDPDTNRQVNRPVVIIDEAHLFEEAMSSATADEMSLSSLRARLEKQQKEPGGTTITRAITLTRTLMDYLRSINTDDRTLVLRNGASNRQPENYNQKINSQITILLRELAEELATRRKLKKIERIESDRKAIAAIIRGLMKGNNRVQVSYSPQRRYPSIMAGRASVSSELSRIWNCASGGAALVSATLWLPDWTKNQRVSYMREILNLPLDRMDTPGSVTWDELFKAPTLYLPDRELAKKLIPPDDPSDLERLDVWCGQQAAVISRLNRDSAGGTLVLCTSYAQVHALKARLVECGIRDKRIVVNSGRLADDQAQYTELYRAGKHPLWLALGPAWTGVDLMERNEQGRVPPASKDFLLSDLVITRIPLGLNRTITMEARMSREFMSVGYDALLRMKQGLGRLIRRSGLKDRRLFVLDGRMMCDPDRNTRFIQLLVSGAHALLENYKKRQTIHLRQ